MNARDGVVLAVGCSSRTHRMDHVSYTPVPQERRARVFQTHRGLALPDDWGPLPAK